MTSPESFKLFDHTCPYCGIKHSYALEPTGRITIQPGAVLVCDACGGVGVLHRDMTFCKPTEAERAAIYANATVAADIARFRGIFRTRKN